MRPEDRKIRLVFCKLHGLHHAAKGPVYGLWILRELAEHGHRIRPGTLYTLPARMEKNGRLHAHGTAGAKERKTYRITPTSRRILERLRDEVEELYRELVPGEKPAYARDHTGGQ